MRNCAASLTACAGYFRARFGKSGLAVTSADRWPTLPDVPTMAEAGVADFLVTSWGALVMATATETALGCVVGA